MKLPKIFGSGKGAMDMAGVVVSVVMATALIPVVAVQIAGTTNISATETTLLGLTTLFIILGLIFGIAKSAGLVKD